MRLETLSIINFKNIRQAEVEFSPRINCMVGDNGTGKTNLLDAINYLAMCKSAFNLSDSQCTTHDEQMFSLCGRFSAGDDRHEIIHCAYKRGHSKKMSRCGKDYEKLSDHIGLIPLVMITPSDSSLVNESGEERRKYINSLISQLDRQYLGALIRYNRLLAERNKLLKNQSMPGFEDILEVIDMQMAESGNFINLRRAEMADTLAPIVARYYNVLSGGKEEIGLEYRSDLNETPMEELLRESMMRDRINTFTTTGVHRDDIIFSIDGHPLRRYGSQGQQKSFLVALKLAQYDIITSRAGYKPILLFDDIFDRLDPVRVGKLLEIVSGDNFSQIFITDCNKQRLEEVLGDNGYTLFNVEDGEISNSLLKNRSEK